MIFPFDGDTYEPALDGPRLTTQFRRVFAFMSDQRWHTLAELALAVAGSEAAVSARLRDLRKPRFGGYLVNRRRLENGLHEYQLISQ